MNFVHHDLGNRSAGEVVEVTLQGNAANVQLMDSANLSNHQHNRRYTYHGGLWHQQRPILTLAAAWRCVGEGF